MSAAPPGWYDDGQHPGYLRRWDGVAWQTEFLPVAPMQPPTPAVRPKWPWALAASCIGFLVLVGVGTWLLVTFVLDASAGPRAAIADFDQAWSTQDCALLEATTSDMYRSLEYWEGDICASLTPDAPVYDIAVEEVRVSGDVAVATTRERWVDVDGAYDERYEYRFTRSDGHWRIDSYDPLDGDVSPVG